jgi:hypothetical protein
MIHPEIDAFEQETARRALVLEEIAARHSGPLPTPAPDPLLTRSRELTGELLRALWWCGLEWTTPPTCQATGTPLPAAPREGASK